MKILSKNKQVIGTIISSVILSILCGILVLYTITFLSSCSNDPIINDPIRIDNKTTIQSIVFSTNLKPRIHTRSLTDNITVGSEATVFTATDYYTTYTYISNSINEMEAKTPSDELFATSTSKTLSVFYPSIPSSNINKSLSLIDIFVANSETEININKDYVYATVNVVRGANEPFTKTDLIFNHLFSLLRIKLIKGSIENIENIPLSYNAPNNARLKINGTINNYTTPKDHYFFESDRILQGATVKSISLDAVVIPIQGTDENGKLTINGNTYKLMDLFSDKLEGGKIYTVEVTINSKSIQFGNIIVNPWTDNDSSNSIIIEQ
jgi:hypothetical protein